MKIVNIPNIYAKFQIFNIQELYQYIFVNFADV